MILKYEQESKVVIFRTSQYRDMHFVLEVQQASLLQINNLKLIMCTVLVHDELQKHITKNTEIFPAAISIHNDYQFPSLK